MTEGLSQHHPQPHEVVILSEVPAKEMKEHGKSTELKPEVGSLGCFKWFQDNLSQLKNAIFLLCLSVFFVRIGFVFYETSEDFSVFGKSYCNSMMLNDGWWQQSKAAGVFRWQPEHCALKAYDHKSAQRCFERFRFRFVGDSQARKLFQAAKFLISNNRSIGNTKHSDLYYNDHLEFSWDPYGNRSDFDVKTDYYIYVVSFGSWYIKYLEGSSALNEYAENVERLQTLFKESKSKAYVLPVSGVVEDKLSVERRMLSNEKILQFNSQLEDILESQDRYSTSRITYVDAWSKMTTYGVDDKTLDGLHFDDSVYDSLLELILNNRCNEDILSTKLPLRSSCCASYPSVDGKQILLFSVLLFLGSFAFISGITFSYNILDDAKTSNTWTNRKFAQAILWILLTCVLCFLSDRTNMLLKQRKEFSEFNFSFLLILFTVVSWLTQTKKEQPGFLNRDITDEWKGWMQVIILVYHYTGASAISPVYNAARILVASYLFMTGYGHASYFLKKKDFSLSRAGSVLLRLNFLSIVLAYFMNSSFQAYYFSPLVSFWFIVIYLVMYIQNNFNDNLLFLLGKIIVASVTVAAALESGIMDGLFNIIVQLSGARWDLKEWHYRVSLDRFIVFVGMICGILNIKLFSNDLWNHKAYYLSSLILSITGIVSTVVVCTMLSKYDYNKIHAWFSCIPVLSFIFLRNLTPAFTQVYSTFCSYIGKISLETFILQFHIWLALDTAGLLVLFPQAYWLNFLATSIIFIIICEKSSEATSVVCDTISKSKFTTKWSICIFIVSLMLINRI